MSRKLGTHQSRTKVLRLEELNKLLDMGEIEEKDNPNQLIEDVKRVIVDFINREYDENHIYDEFHALYLDLKHIGIAYTNILDEKNEIQYEISLDDFLATQYVNNKIITKFDYLKEYGNEEALNAMKQNIEMSSFDDYVSIDDDNLKWVLELERDDNGNICNSLAKDLDNDGVADRYDNDFKDSDYFETTYDVEGNTHSKEAVPEKPSFLKQILSRK